MSKKKAKKHPHESISRRGCPVFTYHLHSLRNVGNAQRCKSESRTKACLSLCRAQAVSTKSTLQRFSSYADSLTKCVFLSGDSEAATFSLIIPQAFHLQVMLRYDDSSSPGPLAFFTSLSVNSCGSLS